MNKFFFMAALIATNENRPVVQFNTVVALDRRNILAAGLTMIQDAGASMCQRDGVVFDNLIIQNIFFLAECTEEEFVAGTELSEQAQAEAAAGELLADADQQAQADEALEARPSLELAVDNTDKNEHVDVQETEQVTETPVADVTSDDDGPTAA